MNFDFEPGRILGGKYEVLLWLGGGWEGEVYLVREIETGVERASKFFYPERNVGNKTLKKNAQKLHRLGRCDIIIHYSTQDKITFRRQKVHFLVSEYVEGVTLTRFIESLPGQRMPLLQAFHLLFALAKGLECVHQAGEYHGDLHEDNIIVTRHGLGFDLKLVDLFHLGSATGRNIQIDVYDMIQIFYDTLGGKKYYARQPKQVKGVICGLKKTLIKKKFRNAGQLRKYLEELSFELPERE